MRKLWKELGGVRVRDDGASSLICSDQSVVHKLVEIHLECDSNGRAELQDSLHFSQIPKHQYYINYGQAAGEMRISIYYS